MNLKDPNARQLVQAWLKANPGLWTSREIGEALKTPVGTVSSALFILTEEARQHRGAGVYAFRGIGRGYNYGWRSSYPKNDPLLVTQAIKSKARKGKHYDRRKAAVAKAANPETRTLVKSTVAPGVWTDGTELFRLVPVRVEVVDIEADV